MSLQDNLTQFIGTEHYYVNPLYRWMRYTDGVKYFCDEAGAYWFLDIIGTELHRVAARHKFIDVVMKVKDGNADIEANDRGPVLWERNGIHTDCPDGIYKFFLQNNVFFLQSEY